MFDPPLTLKEAIAYRYRVWIGSPKGSIYNPSCCAYSVPDKGLSCLFHQCKKKNGKGPEGLYCVRHAKRVKP